MLPVGGGGGRGVERGGAGGAAARAGAAHLPPPHDVPGRVGRRLPRPLRGLVCIHMSFKSRLGPNFIKLGRI